MLVELNLDFYNGFGAALASTDFKTQPHCLGSSKREQILEEKTAR
jgi:hypothetical protein